MFRKELNMAYSVEEAKQLVIDAGLRLQREGLIVRTWGNISARISDTQFVITPSGKGYESLTLDDIVTVDIKKCTYEGDIKPSSECGIHADVFAMRPEVNFVVHTHQTYASVVSIVGEEIELSEEEKKFLGDKVPCANYGMSSSAPLRCQVKKALKANSGCKSMLLRNHGVLCMGTDFENAFEISSCLEQICKYKYEQFTQSYNRIEVNNNLDMGEIDQTADETEEVDTSDLKEGGYVDYGYSHIDGKEITLTLGEDEYKYNIGDKKPIGSNLFKKKLNRIAILHSKIYENRDIRCIYHVTLPATVDVSAKSKGFDAYIDDMAQIVGENVKCVGKIGKKPHIESVSAIVKGLKGNSAVLIAGQGAICAGSSESDVEATAYVLEKSCMAAKLAMCHPSAKSVPKRIAKKERKFYQETYSKLK